MDLYLMAQLEAIQDRSVIRSSLNTDGICQLSNIYPMREGVK